MRVFVLRAFVLSMLVGASVFVQPQNALAQQRNCDDFLTEANTLYSRGSFDETITLIDQCLNTDNLSDIQRRTAFRLKGLSFIGKGLEVDAKNSIKRLLQLVPNYEPDPVLDPPNFVEMIAEVRAEINADLANAENQNNQPPAATEPANETNNRPVAATPTASSRKKKGNSTKLLLAGAGVVGAGVLIAILLSDGPETPDPPPTGGDPISAPPPLP